jgi:hypothetical protein
MKNVYLERYNLSKKKQAHLNGLLHYLVIEPLIFDGFHDGFKSFRIVHCEVG